MSNTKNRLLKELSKLNKCILPKGVLYLAPESIDNLSIWNALITSPLNDSPYHNIIYQLDITIPDEYPLSPPEIKFHFAESHIQKDVCSYIPHSNVHPTTGVICLNILERDQWSPAWTLETAIVAIVMLLDNQVPDSPLNIDVANIVRLNDLKALKSLTNYYNGVNQYSN